VLGQPILSCTRLREDCALFIRDTALDVLCLVPLGRTVLGDSYQPVLQGLQHWDPMCDAVPCCVVLCLMSGVVSGVVSGPCQVCIQSVTPAR
jgi:hypothetical protein